ncbi:UDP-2,3-diacylglucosamine diphosphatase [Marivirga sp.]|uniref:UDP-2,3-diacylglucosamine diphosphatase n=1 Tax=Marivirga sp. TaxID=2018662 RepID=UPI003DA7078E
MITHYKTLVISDVHLGTKGSKAKELVKFLKQCSCDRLILNGDIIDGWQLKKYGTWKRKHTRFFNRILKMIEEYKTEVIYLRGNHDDFLDQVLPFKVGNLTITRDIMIESNGKKFYVVHGDIFDSITTNLKWVAKLGDVGYTFLLWVNSQYNQYRRRKGLPYYSLSQMVKTKVKSAVSYIDDFEKQLVEIAKIKDCDGIVCGHIHQPALKEINGLIYMNSGDWVESMSALAEDNDGNWSLVYYADTSGFKSNHKKIAKINLDEDASIETEEINLRKKTA